MAANNFSTGAVKHPFMVVIFTRFSIKIKNAGVSSQKLTRT